LLVEAGNKFIDLNLAIVSTEILVSNISQLLTNITASDSTTSKVKSGLGHVEDAGSVAGGSGITFNGGSWNINSAKITTFKGLTQRVSKSTTRIRLNNLYSRTILLSGKGGTRAGVAAT
jgi:hypothetical protein